MREGGKYILKKTCFAPMSVKVNEQMKATKNNSGLIYLNDLLIRVTK